MLRSVRLKNFVKFKDDIYIPFPFDEAYFFVGENGSGKTSVFEAVRRCLNLESSTSFSTKHNDEESTYIVCEYDKLPDEGTLMNYKKLFTSYVHISNHSDKYGKVVMCLGKKDDKQIDVFMEIVTRLDKKEYKVANNDVILQQPEQEELKTSLLALTKPESNERSEKYLQCVANIITRNSITTAKKHFITETEVERLLRALNKCVVITFSQRSIGPLQWSKSVRINPKERESNYSLARTRCEIITAFLSGQHKYDTIKEKRLFKALTGESNIIFQKPAKKENVKVTIDNQPVEILKVPQGILEAKNLSLLLSSTEFRTVLLEEPDNGMHPQMIQKCRDILLPQVGDKVIIIITHNPAFIDALTIYNTIKFYIDDTTSRAILVGDKLKNTQTEHHKTARLVASEEYTNILFARKVFFVEGGSDYLFIKHLFSYLLNPQKTDSSIEVLVKAKVGKNDDDHRSCLDKLRHLIASLHVVSMGGEKSKVRWNLVSHILKIPRIFLLDRDVVVEKDLKSVPELVEEKVNNSLMQMLSGKENNEEIAHILQRKAIEETTDFGQNIDFTSADQKLKEKLNDSTNVTSDDVVKAYRNYYFAVSKKVQDDIKTAEKFTINLQPTHLITKLKPKEKIQCVSNDAEKLFRDNLEKDNWNEARKCLQDEGVFVWKEGDLEDSFIEIILETEDGTSEENKIYRVHERNKIFSTLNLQLDLTKNFRGESKPGSKPKKLYMDDKVSVDDIDASIDRVLRLCSEKSDIVNLIAFLFRCANGDVQLLPNIE